MESRLKILALTGSMAVILLVVLLVLWQNGMFSPQTPSGEKPVQQVTDAGTQAGGSQGAVQDRDGHAIGGDLSGFLRDEGFFDPEKDDSVLDSLREQGHALSLLATSVEKDLRLLVVDFAGEPVTGESFVIRLSDAGENASEYRDLDRDGIVYVGALKAGEYTAELLPIAGYVVPVEGTRVRVKEQVEYIAIDDISVLLHTEEEIDAAKEDLAQRDLAEDTDETENAKLQAGVARTLIGIDVSKYQGEIDWNRVAAAGVEFAIIRCGYRGRSTGTLVVDPTYERNIRGAKAAGLKVGIYFFTQAVSEAEAVEEASAAMELAKGYDLDLPIYIDSEGSGGVNGRADGLDADTRTLVCEAFCRTVKNAGLESGVYASRHWLQHNLHTEKLGSFETWLAEYRSVPLYEGYYMMWQYTSRGSVDGIEGYVDLDLRYE
ncbi:MAG: glycoside hydrolase family 25 protein [Lachnospiraceae bacterium]|nr:glycoside hydrolase family 25 protein [Lachnospiraceae bacterium]